MPRIRCHYIDCVFLDDGYCGAAAVEIDPDEGCMTYTMAEDMIDEDAWEEDEDISDEDWEELELEEDEEDLWLDEDEF